MARTRLPPVASTSWCVLGPDRPPPDVPRHRWRQFVNDCHNFLNHSEGLAERAARLGWDEIGLFGCAPRRSAVPWPGYRLAIDDPSGPDLRAIYGTAACSALDRVPAHALALFGTPGNFRLKRRGISLKKRWNCRHFARCRHDLLRSKKRGDGVTKLNPQSVCRGRAGESEQP